MKNNFRPILYSKTKKSANMIPWYTIGSINPIAAYSPEGSSSIASSYINLINPGTYNAVPGSSSPTWSATNGWIFPNSGTAILTTGLTIAANTWSVIVKFNCGGPGGGGAGSGRAVSGNADTFYITPNAAGANRVYRNGNVNTVSGALTGAYIMSVCNTACYLNSSTDGTISVSVLSAGELCIGNRLSDLGRPFYGNILKIAIYSVTLTTPQITSLVSVM